MSIVQPQTSTLKSGERCLIRSATPADAQSILDIRREAAEEGAFVLRELSEFSVTIEKQVQEIVAQNSEPRSVYLVAEVQHDVVGFAEAAGGGLRRTQHVALLSIYIATAYRDRGIGGWLMQALIDWATDEPLLEKLTLAVFSTNTRARALYEKMGFEQEGYCPHDMKLADGTYVDSVLMYRFVK
jgi:RimJ/RimL family protein N-acetyltransferase